MIHKKYSELDRFSIFYYLTKTTIRPIYNFIYDEYYYEHGRMISFEDAKKRYDDNFGKLVSYFDTNGYSLFLEKFAIDYKNKEIAKEKIESLKSLSNFHEYCFEIDWEN